MSLDPNKEPIFIGTLEDYEKSKKWGGRGLVLMEVYVPSERLSPG